MELPVFSSKVIHAVKILFSGRTLLSDTGSLLFSRDICQNCPSYRYNSPSVFRSPVCPPDVLRTCPHLRVTGCLHIHIHIANEYSSLNNHHDYPHFLTQKPNIFALIHMFSTVFVHNFPPSTQNTILIHIFLYLLSYLLFPIIATIEKTCILSVCRGYPHGFSVRTPCAIRHLQVWFSIVENIVFRSQAPVKIRLHTRRSIPEADFCRGTQKISLLPEPPLPTIRTLSHTKWLETS